MSNNSDRNYVSVGSWMLLMLVTAIPVVGQIFVLVLAFVGDNDSRKNYFRAVLAWILIFIGVVAALALIGNTPTFVKQIQSWWHR